ncbi:hypothetical protein Cantr_08200 [Candida viswanathii]|uniref:Opaque-phase-specific protein OP4 n=1 Tax=Candida viswanathii TaxID=5486 RepID=A0A367Y3Q5_9ASCO|nr:hypothetical protein Cantr_08200 [Candida viswanathii]
MRLFALSNLLPVVSFCLPALVSASPSPAPDYTKYNYLLESIRSLSSDLDKRDDAQVAQLTSLFEAVGSSGLISDIILDITSSDTKMDNLANITVELLGAVENGNQTFEGINIQINTTELLDAVLASGLIQSTATGLLLNNTNNAILADFVGGILGNPNNVWIGWLLMGLGEGHALTVPYLADLIVNTTSKANTNSTNQSNIKGANFKQADNIIIEKKAAGDYDEEEEELFGSLDGYLNDVLNTRDDDNQYAGSFNSFVNNIINTVATSSLVQSSINDILIALNNSGIIVPTVMEVIANPNLGTLVLTVVSRLYESGELDNIPIDPYYQFAKQQGYLSDGLQYILTDPTYSPGLAVLFKRMDDAGAYQRLQDNMYGVND